LFVHPPRSRLLTAYDSRSWKIGRATGNKTIFIPHAALSLFGIIQPGILPRMFDTIDADSGFLQRILFIFAKATKPQLWSEACLSEKAKLTLDNMTESLLELEMEGDKPGYTGVSMPAKKLFQGWYDRIAVEQFEGLSEVSSLLPKLRGQAARVCLLLHLMEWATGTGEGNDAVSEQTMSNALRLADWLRAHSEHAWALINSGGEGVVSDLNPVQVRVAKAIIGVAGQRTQVPVSEITQATNQGMSDASILTGAKVGRVCRELGLEGKRGSRGKRGMLITSKILTRLKASVTTATTVTSHGISCSYKGVTSPSEPSPTATQPELGVADVADEDQSATQLNLEYHDTSGGSGGSGGSLGAKNEFPS
jgi:hypothetical protein